MKKINLLLVFCLAILTFAQAQIPPQAFNYSAVARNAAGQPIATATIGIQVSILKTSSTGVSQYSENHFVNTDAFGLFNLVIGGGAVQSGSMSTIDWSNDNYYLKVGMDATGGTNFLTMGTTQLLSVPYAMHAATADSIVGGTLFSGNYNDLTNKPITVTSISANGDTLLLSNGQSFISASSSTNLPSIATDSVYQWNAGYSTASVYVASTILNDGGETIIRRGICFGTNSNLTTSNSSTTDIAFASNANGGSDLGSQIRAISGLLHGTQYYFRSFAVNINGTSYGQVISYTTPVVTLPHVNTLPTTNILVYSATLNGELIDFGNDNWQGNNSGICYGTSPNPTISDNVSPWNVTSFTTNSLQANTTYYVRAFATNSIGTSYGNQVTFTTQQLTLPDVTTQQVTNITNSSADLTGLISSSGNVDCEYGFFISTNPNPSSTSNDYVINELGGLSGSYTINTSQQFFLDPNTTYYVRAYVLSDCQGAGVYTYGNEVSFTTTAGGAGIVTNPGAGVTFNGYTYASIVLGNGQEWMAENLRTTSYANGDPIPNVTNDTQWENLTTGAWAHYNNDSQYENPYGKLYNWYTVNDSRNVCPNGWHVPTDAEWSTLINYLDPNAAGGDNSQNTAGGKMKSTGTQYWSSPNVATNESGFSGFPGGFRNYLGSFYSIGIYGFWWSSSEVDTVDAWDRKLYSSGEYVNRGNTTKSSGLTVRCLRD